MTIEDRHLPTKSSFGLYLVLTRPIAGYEKCTEAAVEHRVRYVQLRMKDEPAEDVLRMARRLRAITRGTSTRFIVNDDVDIAMAAQADGVHVGQDDMSVSRARARWQLAGKLFGLSTHDEAQAVRAIELGPDYIGVGPVFATPTKTKPDPVLGVERAAAIAVASPLTSVAIGGIDEQNLPQLLAAGIVNFAVVRAVCHADDPRARIADLLAVWQAAPD